MISYDNYTAALKCTYQSDAPSRHRQGHGRGFDDFTVIDPWQHACRATSNYPKSGFHQGTKFWGGGGGKHAKVSGHICRARTSRLLHATA